MAEGEKVTVEEKTTKVTMKDGTTKELPMKVTTTEHVDGRKDVTIALPRISFTGKVKQ